MPVGYSPPFYMKIELIYISHPMTNMTNVDKYALVKAKKALQEAGMFVHCPADSEAKNQPLPRCQEADFQFMAPCNGHFVVWPIPYGKLSVGSIGELEWARRVYRIPSVIWVSTVDKTDFPVIDLMVPEWCRANAEVFTSLPGAIEALRTRIERNRK